MKPRTKLEKAVTVQSGHLRPLSTAPRRWAFQNTINHYAYRLPKGSTTCMDCGHSWLMTEHTDKCTCPNCKAQLEIKETYARKCEQKSYFNVIAKGRKFCESLVIDNRFGVTFSAKAAKIYS